MADAFTIIIAGFLGGIGLGLSNKMIEYYWETKWKSKMMKLDSHLNKVKEHAKNGMKIFK
jgi:hypothetical protein